MSHRARSGVSAESSAPAQAAMARAPASALPRSAPPPGAGAALRRLRAALRQAGRR